MVTGSVRPARAKATAKAELPARLVRALSEVTSGSIERNNALLILRHRRLAKNLSETGACGLRGQ